MKQVTHLQRRDAAGVPNVGSSSAAKKGYRADIDGLRAIAVLLVVLEHLHTRILGGYIGVDVFFVISGYLISGTILREMKADCFSIGAFYERRVRRILPALLVMLLGTSVLALCFFVPSEIEAFGWSMLSTLCSVSNLFFSHQAGYFDGPSELKPLLHTWSLAVEEQFYVVFPLFLICLRRWFPKRVRTAIWLVAGTTFGLACFWARYNPTQAFFLAPLRAWELLVGTLISQGYVLQSMGTVKRNCAAAVGLLLILLPAVLYTAQTSFPGLAALPPCLGAALVISAGDSGPSLISRALAMRPVVSIGLVSYSLYLWHWPILVFQRTGYMLVDDPPESKSVKAVVFLVSITVAFVSWRFVERPFREGRLRPRRSVLLLLTGAGSIAVLIAAVLMVLSHGFPGRFPSEALEIDAFTRYVPAVDFRQNVCFMDKGNTFADFNKTVCLAADPVSSTSRTQYLLLGDSHAAHLYHGLTSVFKQKNFSQATAASCRPFISQMKKAGTCGDLMRYVFGEYLLKSRPQAVLLAGDWKESELRELGETTEWLEMHQQTVVLLGPSIEFTEPLPRLLTMALRDHDLGLVQRHRDQEGQELDVKMAHLALASWHVRYISAFRDLCAAQIEMQSRSQLESGSSCPVYAAPGVPLLFDTDHFTPAGSVLYAKAIREHSELP